MWPFGHFQAGVCMPLRPQQRRTDPVTPRLQVGQMWPRQGGSTPQLTAHSAAAGTAGGRDHVSELAARRQGYREHPRRAGGHEGGVQAHAGPAARDGGEAPGQGGASYNIL